MRDSRPLRRPVRAAVAILTLFLVGGCTNAPVDRAGGDAGRDVRVLTLGQFAAAPGPALEVWAGQVEALSGGSLRVEFKNDWRKHEAGFETGTLGDVRAGTLDVAVVGARVLDRFGVTSFHALLAPMLVDSQALQAKVFAAGIPDEMARHLEPAGVVGLGTLPGPMRKMLGVSKPFLRPSDFRDATVGIQDSVLTAKTFTTLGAVTKVVGPGAALTGLAGYEQQLGSIVGNHYVDAAQYVTANLNLWPRPQVIIASPATLRGLPGRQRRALEQAVDAARPVAEQVVQKEDGSSAATLCRDGMRLPTASPQDLRAMSAALGPVLDELEAEPGTAAWLERIRTVKAQLAARPDAQACPDERVAGIATPIPNGTYKREVIRGEAVPGCPPNTEFAEARWFYLLELDNGFVTEYSLSSTPGATPEVGWVGTYRVFRDRVDFSENQAGIVLSAAWTLDGKKLTLSDLKGGTCGDANVWTARPWTRVS
jgi:TRAP-type C4-dicarboxylate transport system substrate-binding protein